MLKPNNLVFYREWFPLPKGEFRILAMLADKGQFRGNLSDLCRYFFVSPQTATRNRLSEQISTLEQQGYITVERTGRIYTLTAIPKAEKIRIEREHYERIRTRARRSEGESVAWECVLKVYLWAKENDYDDIITNLMIQTDLNLSVGVICSAKNVLDREFGAIRRHKVSKQKTNGDIYTIGQNIGTSAFWDCE